MITIASEDALTVEQADKIYEAVKKDNGGTLDGVEHIDFAVENGKGKISYHKDEDAPRFERIRRITGYLVGTVDRWNNAKQAELHDRVKHA